MVIAIALAAGILHYSFSGDKPPHIDDPQHIYAARQLIKDAMHPDDYTVYWNGRAMPGSSQSFAHTPVWPALLALPLSTFGEKPEGLHLAMAPFTSALVLATGFISIALGIPAIPVALLASISPAIAVYASRLMPDLPAVAIALLALLCVLQGGKTRKWQAMGGLLFILSSFLSNIVLALFPVVLLASFRDRKYRSSITWAVMAIIGALAWPIARLVLEPGAPGFMPALVSWKDSISLSTFAAKGGFALATLAGAIVHPGIWVVLLGARLGRPGRLRALAAVALSILLLAFLKFNGVWQKPVSLEIISAPAGINAWWFGGAGLAMAAWLFNLVMEARGKNGAAARHLLAWTSFCIIGALLAPASSSRFIISAIPAVLILLVRDIYILLRPGLQQITMGALGAGTLWLAIGLVQADLRSAWASVDLINVATKEIARTGTKGALATDWGFQYQGLDRGFLLPARDPDALVPGRILVITSVAPMHLKMPAGLGLKQVAVAYSEAPDLPLRTIQPETSAGFYGNGWLPYSFCTKPVEKMVIARVVRTGPNR